MARELELAATALRNPEVRGKHRRGQEQGRVGYQRVPLGGQVGACRQQCQPGRAVPVSCCVQHKKRHILSNHGKGCMPFQTRQSARAAAALINAPQQQYDLHSRQGSMRGSQQHSLHSALPAVPAMPQNNEQSTCAREAAPRHRQNPSTAQGPGAQSTCPAQLSSHTVLSVHDILPANSPRSPPDSPSLTPAHLS